MTLPLELWAPQKKLAAAPFFHENALSAGNNSHGSALLSTFRIVIFDPLRDTVP